MRATHRVLKPDARHCFYVIVGAEDLTQADRERMAEREGNEFVGSALPYETLMSRAGFTDVEVTDVTAEFARILIEFKRSWEADAKAFVELVGPQEYERKLRNRNLDIEHVEDGLLRRLRVIGAKG